MSLVREQVVADAEPRHGGEVAAHDAVCHVLGEPGGVVAALLDRVQRLGLQFLARRVLGVEVAHLRVEIPAVVVEPPADRRHLRERLLLEVEEADDHVRDLNARVVDVVLHADLEAALAQQAHERVTEAGVAQVADVRGLVRVDRGVLHDHPPRPRRRGGSRGERLVEPLRKGSPFEEEVEVAAAGDLGAADTGHRSEPLGQRLGDLAWLAPQRLG